MIKLQNYTPEVYYKESRDFQFIGRLYDLIFNSVKTNSDQLYNLPLSDNSNEEWIDLMALTLGFKPRHNYNVKQLVAVCNILPTILRNKGTLRAIELIGNAILKSEGVKDSIYVSLSSIDSTRLQIGLPTLLEDITLLQDLLDYVLPAGMTCEIITEATEEINNAPTISVFDQSLFHKSIKDYITSIVSNDVKSNNLLNHHVNEEGEKEFIPGLISNTTVIKGQTLDTSSWINPPPIVEDDEGPGEGQGEGPGEDENPSGGGEEGGEEGSGEDNPGGTDPVTPPVNPPSGGDEEDPQPIIEYDPVGQETVETYNTYAAKYYAGQMEYHSGHHINNPPIDEEVIPLFNLNPSEDEEEYVEGFSLSGSGSVDLYHNFRFGAAEVPRVMWRLVDLQSEYTREYEPVIILEGYCKDNYNFPNNLESYSLDAYGREVVKPLYLGPQVGDLNDAREVKALNLTVPGTDIWSFEDDVDSPISFNKFVENFEITWINPNLEDQSILGPDFLNNILNTFNCRPIIEHYLTDALNEGKIQFIKSTASDRYKTEFGYLDNEAVELTDLNSYGHLKFKAHDDINSLDLQNYYNFDLYSVILDPAKVENLTSGGNLEVSTDFYLPDDLKFINWLPTHLDFDQTDRSFTLSFKFDGKDLSTEIIPKNNRLYHYSPEALYDPMSINTAQILNAEIASDGTIEIQALNQMGNYETLRYDDCNVKRWIKRALHNDSTLESELEERYLTEDGFDPTASRGVYGLVLRISYYNDTIAPQWILLSCTPLSPNQLGLYQWKYNPELDNQ